MSSGTPIRVPEKHAPEPISGKFTHVLRETRMTASVSSPTKNTKKDTKKIKGDTAVPQTGQSLESITTIIPIMESSVSTTTNSNKRKHVQASSPSLATTCGTTGTQLQLITNFKEHRSNIQCIKCSNKSCITITDIKEEIIFSCTICKIEVSQYVISTQLSLLKKTKKNKIDTTDPITIRAVLPALSGTNESLVTEADKLLLINYHTIRHLLTCPTCHEINSINKNGHNKSVPPRPIFKCRCGKTFSIDNIRDLMDNYKAQQQQQNEQQIIIHSNNNLLEEIELEQENFNLNDFEDDIMHDNTKTNNDNNIIVSLIETVNAMKEQLNRHDEQFTNFRGLMDQNKQLQKEILFQKRELEQLKKLNNQYKKEKEQMLEIINKSQRNTKDSNEQHIIEQQKNNTKNKNEQKNTENSEIIYLKETQNIYTITNPTYPPNSTTIQNEAYEKSFPSASITRQQSNPISYASKAAATPKVHTKMSKKKMAHQIYRFNTPTTDQLEIASKAFDDSILTNPPDYQFVHFPCSRRLKPSELRQRLTLLGADNIRVIDAHCPDYNVAEFLVHENYVDELKAKFSQARVETLDYDFTDPVHLRDSRLASLTKKEKVQKLKEIRTNYLLNRIKYIRYPVNYSVAKSLFRNNHITLEELKTTLKSCREGKGVDGFTTSPSAGPQKQQQQSEIETSTSSTTSIL